MQLTDNRPPHLQDKWNVYMIRFENGSIVKLHVSRPTSFRTFVETFILQHIELTVEKTTQKFETKYIAGIEKIPNSNKPDYEATAAGLLKEIL